MAAAAWARGFIYWCRWRRSMEEGGTYLRGCGDTPDGKIPTSSTRGSEWLGMPVSYRWGWWWKAAAVVLQVDGDNHGATPRQQG
jgi:hypothetical protein